MARLFQFFEITGVKFRVGRIEWSTDPESVPFNEDPFRAAVRFSQTPLIESEPAHQEVVFYYSYFPGDEGTRGSLDQLLKIEYIQRYKKDPVVWTFLPENTGLCNSPDCPNRRYWFAPAPIEWEDRRGWNRLSEFEKLSLIKGYLKTQPAPQPVGT